MARTLLLAGLEDIPFVEYRHGFVAEGFQVDSAYQLDHAVGMVAMNAYDAVIVFSRSAGAIHRLLDAMSASFSLTAIVLCVCPVNDDEEMALLQAGVTACRPDGVRFSELLAQIRAMLRRLSGYPKHYRIGDLGIDPVGRRASRCGIPLRLRPREFDLLLLLAESEGQTVRKEALMEQLWPARPSSANLLAAHMRNLRVKLEKGHRNRLLHTVPNQGYLLSETPPSRQRTLQETPCARTPD